MSPVILLGLVALWAVVLVPMWLRRHDEIEETRSVDRFSTAMHTLSRREAPVDKKYVVMPHRSRSVEVHVSGASADGQRPARRRPSAPRPTTPRPTERRVRTAATRRRRTLIGLLVTTVLTVAAAIVVGGLPLWGLQIVADCCLLAFVAHLVTRGRRDAAMRPARRRPVAPARPRPVAEFEYDNDDDQFEPVAVTTRATTTEPAPAAEPLFDQTRSAVVEIPAYEDEPTYEDEAYAAEEAVVAASASRIEFEPVAADEFFDQTADYQPPLVPERAAPREPAGRDVEIDIPLSDPVAQPAAAAGNEIGARPWEPVPVPRPVYASKPVAPPRSPRAPTFEPLLPPIETAAELDPVDDLEEILDRRWAVND